MRKTNIKIAERATDASLFSVLLGPASRCELEALQLPGRFQVVSLDRQQRSFGFRE